MSNFIMRERLEDEERLSEECIDFMIDRFLEDVKSGVWKEEGWPRYGPTTRYLSLHSMPTRGFWP
ncbi:hypothetical protein Sjap_009237 [Stephania japonica]|uniref:Uncharacterized protein n=1 Tax=Stephania japonica TaxID=461633 RepID=A0AAP0JQZ6_9MAGN